MGMIDSFTGWARRTTSSFSELRADIARPDTPDSAAPVPGDLIYRLKQWPQLPASMKTAEVLQLVSLMSSRPVRRSWILDRTRLTVKDLDFLVRRLTAQDALEVIDPSALPVERPAR